jgi:hypothetical protein
VGHCGGVVVRVHVVGQVLGRHEGQLRDGVAEVAHARVEALDRGVDLGAVARREDDRLAHVVPADEVGQHLGQAVGRDGGPLEQLEGGAAVVEPEDDE